MAKITRQVKREQAVVASMNLAHRVGILEAYQKSIDKFFVVLEKHHPEWFAEAFGGPQSAQTGGGGGVDEAVPAIQEDPKGAA